MLDMQKAHIGQEELIGSLTELEILNINIYDIVSNGGRIDYGKRDFHYDCWIAGSGKD